MRRQLDPFLEAGVQPDIILLETEGSAGFLFTEPIDNGKKTHDRGVNDGNVSKDQVTEERCGSIATGHIDAYPKLAGYYKQEMLSARSAIADSGRDESSHALWSALT